MSAAVTHCQQNYYHTQIFWLTNTSLVTSGRQVSLVGNPRVCCTNFLQDMFYMSLKVSFHQFKFPSVWNILLPMYLKKWKGIPSVQKFSHQCEKLNVAQKLNRSISVSIYFGTLSLWLKSVCHFKSASYIVSRHHERVTTFNLDKQTSVTWHTTLMY